MIDWILNFKLWKQMIFSNNARLLVLILTCVASPIWGWGMTGHRIVGGVAHRYLAPSTVKKISSIFHGYRLEDIGNWADEIKSDHTAFSLSLGKWHFIEVADLSALDQAIDLKQWPENLNQALHFVVYKLKNRLFDDDLTEAVLVRLLVHLVADAHQPLHVGNGKDHGANTCYVRWFGSKWLMSLHSVWDSKLVDSYKLSYSEYVDYLDHVDDVDVLQWQQDSIKTWLVESREIHPLIYPSEKSGSPSDYCVKSRASMVYSKAPTLGYAYQNSVRPILHKRLLQAGIRLAGILNEIYTPGSL